jgi:hypothetical protein
MMVAVGLLVLMMTVIVSVFQSATGAIQEQRAYAALDQDLRRLDSMIRMDLAGVTARMTPPNDPGQNQGYFEYSEGALADSQGEDSDDTLRFTAKAPDGQPFVGNVWLPNSIPATDPLYMNVALPTLRPVRVTSQYAEIVYFLRNGNLYRRVVLIKPQLASTMTGAAVPPFVGNSPTDPELYDHLFTPNDRGFNPTVFGFRTNIFAPATEFVGSGNAGTMTLGGFPFVGWLGMNDLSARPSAFPTGYLGYPDPTQIPISTYAPALNTLGDLTKRENRIFNPRAADDWVNNSQPTTLLVPDGLPDDENDMDGDVSNGFEGDGVPDWPSILYPSIFSPTNAITGNQLVFELNNFGVAATTPRMAPHLDNAAFPFVYPNAYSVADFPGTSTGQVHSLDPTVSPVGNGSDPYFGTYISPPYNHNPVDVGDSLPAPGGPQTWWGFPTWRETMSPYWLDPIKRLNDPPAATYFSAFLGPMAGADGSAAGFQSPGLSYRAAINGGARFWLPPLNSAATPYPNPQPFADASGSGFFALPPDAVWEEDLIATGVRSFDVKALDPNAKMINPATGTIVYLPPGYYDLGYGNMLTGTNPLFLDSFAHEGRMPPLTTDYRSNPQFPALEPNIGDDNATVVRLRRVWDSWSTSYTNVPSVPRIPFNGPLAGLPPTFPSYPAPYPAPLRGIQIQIRLASPDGQRVRTLTIQQDFTDKL